MSQPISLHTKRDTQLDKSDGSRAVGSAEATFICISLSPFQCLTRCFSLEQSFKQYGRLQTRRNWVIMCAKDIHYRVRTKKKSVARERENSQDSNEHATACQTVAEQSILFCFFTRTAECRSFRCVFALLNNNVLRAERCQ